MKATDQIDSTGLGRIILHAICLVRSPRHLTWHWQGILRELQFNLPHANRLYVAHAGRGARSVFVAIMLLSIPLLGRTQSTTPSLLTQLDPKQTARTNAVRGGRTFTNRVHKTGAETNASLMNTPQPVDSTKCKPSPLSPPTELRIVVVRQP